jgi:hypothetical protein
MGLMQKLFGGGAGSKRRKEAPGSSQFAESRVPTSLEQTKSRNAPRRELVKLVLRETMRKHGIPSDWMDCRALSVLTHQHKSGMHVQFLVMTGDHQLLRWVHAFQESFWEEILRSDPKAREWLFSVGWEFYGQSIPGFNVLPGAGAWHAEQRTETQPLSELPSVEEPQEAGDTLPPEQADESGDDQLASDLQALQQAISQPAELRDVPEPRSRRKG